MQGNKELLGDLTKTFPPWIALTNGKDYSYSKMTAINATHLLWEQISATQVPVVTVLVNRGHVHVVGCGKVH